MPVGAAFMSFGVLSVGVACSGQPGAAELWAMPGQSSARDAHVTITASGASTGGRVALQGDGTVVFKPRPAMHLQLQSGAGALPVQLDVLEVDGITYQRGTVEQRWARSSTPAPDPTWSRATAPRLVDQVSMAGTNAWHLQAVRQGALVDMWVRQRDGYPLKVAAGSEDGTVFTFAFDHFNSGPSVVAPLPSEIEPPARHLTGNVGDALLLNDAKVAVLSCDADAASDDQLLQPRPGNRFVVVEVSVENTGLGPLSTFLEWRLSDSSGGAWDEALAVRQPSFVGGELEPGESARGFLTYEVPRSASDLTLSVKLDGDRARFDLT